MNHFDRRQLRYFVAVAEELHFGQAARRLNMSQPPLSQQIAALEADLGVQLFVRSKRKVEITPAGREFLHDARDLLARMSKAAVKVKAIAAGQSGLLRIGLSYSAPISPLLSKIFRHYAQSHPSVRLELHENTSAAQLDGLRRRNFDLCFIWPTRDDASPDMTIVPISNCELKFITAHENSLARKRGLTAADLKNQPIFLTQRQTRTQFYKNFLTACCRAGFEPDIHTDIIQMPFIMNIVAANQGISFLPNFFDRVRPEGTVFRTCTFLPPAARVLPLALAFRTGDLSPLVKNFADIAVKAAGR